MNSDQFFRDDPSARVSRMVPDGQNVISVDSETDAGIALAMMLANSFSQLPVLLGNEVIGTFTFQSFNERFSDDSSVDLKTYPVSEFLRKPSLQFYKMTDHYGEIMERLFTDGAVLIGDSTNLQGLVSAADALKFLGEASRPFMLVRECELTMRSLIRLAFRSESDLNAFAVNALGGYLKHTGKKMPESLEHMSVGELKTIVDRPSADDDSSVFKLTFLMIFGERVRARRHFERLNTIRNTIMHFRSEISLQDSRDLDYCRAWLNHRAKYLQRILP